MKKRNIISTIAISKSEIHFSVLEILDTDVVSIFSDSGTLNNMLSFIKVSKNKAEQIVGGKIKNVVFSIDSSKKIAGEINMSKKSIPLVNGIVSKEDLRNLKVLIQDEIIDSTNKLPISIQPILYDIEDTFKKQYNECPVNKKGTRITLTAMVTTISRRSHEDIQRIANSCDLNISQIFLSPQTIVSNSLEKDEKQTGALSIHIDKESAFLGIVRNHALIKIVNMNELSFSNLIKGISIKAKCSEKKAKHILHVYGSLKQKENRVIKELSRSEENFVFTTNNLNGIIFSYINMLKKNINSLLQGKLNHSIPFVVTGELNKLPNIVEHLSDNLGIGVRVPTRKSIIEKRKPNIFGLGYIKLQNSIDQIEGNNSMENIVETNPESIDTILLHTKKNSNKWKWVKAVVNVGKDYNWKSSLVKGGKNVR